MFRKNILLFLSLLLFMTTTYAAAPVWTLTPLTATSVTIAKNSTATISYLVTNQSSRTHTLTMNPIQGVTQVTSGAGLCSNPFTLAGKGSCVLQLLVNGNQAASGSTNGPVICDSADPLQCYRPSATNLLSIRVTPNNTQTFTVGGAITGLTGTVQLANNGTDLTNFNANGSFTFPTGLANGANYNVTVTSQPANQMCTVTNGSGTIINANVINVTVNCMTTSYSVGGNITNLSGTVQLANNGTDLTNFNASGPFTFPTFLADGASYNVTVATQPGTQTCSISNGSGVINSANVTNVGVTCSQNAYTVGGTVSGLTGTVVLQNNGADDQTITTDGSYTFSAPVAQGAPYSVTVLTQPVTQTCTVSNGSGTMGGANVTNVNVSCVTNNSTMTTSLSDLLLKTNGNARTITVTNTGANTIAGLVVTNPSFPSGTTAITDCGSTLAAAATCTITVTPGANSTSNCSSGSTPTPGVITVSADNAASVTTNVTVLNYFCIYQRGYVFAIDDTTATNTSVIGSTLALSDNSASHEWTTSNVVSTTATSKVDGVSNTAAIMGSAVATGSAAELCSNYTIDSSGNSPCSVGTCYSSWYFPAICQLGGTGLGASCPAMDNVTDNLSSLISPTCTGSPSCLPVALWSSTQAALSDAWAQQFNPGLQFTIDKLTNTNVRCARNF